MTRRRTQAAIDGSNNEEPRTDPNPVMSPLSYGVRSPPCSAEQLNRLLRQSANGDESAFTSVYRAMQPRVLSVCAALLRDPVAARETAADALALVWRRAGTYDPERGQALAWILAVARHLAVDRMRQMRRAAAREEELDAACAQPTPDMRPDDLTQRRQWAYRLQRALKTLPAVQRQTVVASFLLGLSHREIARLSGQPVGTVKGRIRGGLTKLRSRLAGSA